MEGSPMSHHHGMVLCWTPRGLEADPGILNPGRGPRKIKTMTAHQRGAPPIGLQKSLSFFFFFFRRESASDTETWCTKRDGSCLLPVLMASPSVWVSISPPVRILFDGALGTDR